MKQTTISARLLRTLQKGKEQLGADALCRVVCFLESQRTEEHSFINKSGKADLYYTSFGWTLSYLLGIKTDLKKMGVYLSQQEPERLDLIHYAAYMRCRMIKQLMEGGKAGLFVRSLFTHRYRAIISCGDVLHTFKSIPHNDLQAPYTQFVRLSLLEDTGQRIKEKKDLTDSLANYRISEGGYKNTKSGLTATTNATVAALTVKGQLTGYQENEDVLYLRNSQDISGGFRAAVASPVPDLLSTATALFILSCYKVSPNYPARDFIEAHWLDSGGFAATLLEDKSDVEYTYYGLLALGAM